MQLSVHGIMGGKYLLVLYIWAGITHHTQENDHVAGITCFSDFGCTDCECLKSPEELRGLLDHLLRDISKFCFVPMSHSAGLRAQAAQNSTIQ